MNKNQLDKLNAAIQSEEKSWDNWENVYLGFSGNPSERQRRELFRLSSEATALSIKCRGLIREVIEIDNGDDEPLASCGHPERYWKTEPDNHTAWCLCCAIEIMALDMQFLKNTVKPLVEASETYNRGPWKTTGSDDACKDWFVATARAVADALAELEVTE